jgi:CubicO group peptidase (beta-lactamase class C family)
LITAARGTQAQIANLSEMIPDLMSGANVAGLAIAIIRDGELVLSQAFGSQEIRTKRAVTPGTVFEAGSLSKPVFAYAVLKTCERGMINLDAAMADYLPRPFFHGEPLLQRVTARMVLSHTTGFENWRTRGERLKFVAAPGQQFTYSGEGYVYLQRVIDFMTGTTLSDFMRLNVFEPFGMENSSYIWRKEFAPAEARSYDKEGKLDNSLTWKYAHGLAAAPDPGTGNDIPELAYPNAASSLYTTAVDFAKFMIEIMRSSGQDKFHLSEASVDEMLKPQISAVDSIYWGLGWGIQRTKADDYFFHWANQNSFQHFAIMSNKQGCGVVVTTNSGNGLRVCRSVVASTIGGEIPILNYLES